MTASTPHPKAIAGRLTKRASKFAEVNRTLSTISGARLDTDRRRVTAGPETWVKLRYRFEDGQQITLDQADMASMAAVGIEPVWIGDRRKAVLSHRGIA